MEVGLSLGANLGDRLACLREARDRVAGLPGTRVLASSSVYETEPVDVSASHRDKTYLNAVIVVDTDLDPGDLAVRLRRMESAMGRVRTEDRNAPRPIDLDILYTGAMRIDGPDLTVPHSRWNERRFVVQPLADVRPALCLPGEPRTVREVLLALPDTPDVVLFEATW